MIPKIFDNGDGIEIEFDFENGMSIKCYIDDYSAAEMCNIIINKLNARGY